MSLRARSLSWFWIAFGASFQACGGAAATVEREPFGTLPDGTAVELFTLTNASGMEVRLTNFGAIVTAIRVPDRKGRLDDVVLGYGSLEGYVKNPAYFGALIGRYTNRIANARFTLDGRRIELAANAGGHALHGGRKGFDEVVWAAKPFARDGAAGVALTHLSPDGDQGYPGTLDVHVTYTLTAANELAIDYRATTDAPTVVNLTHHGYFNLAGEGSGDVLGHVLMVNADRYTPVDENLIPLGTEAPVDGTPLDFRTPTPIGARIASNHPQMQRAAGYDHNYVLKRGGPGVMLAARVVEPKSGRVLEVRTTEPGMQFYTANHLDVIGKGGHRYRRRHGFSLETQHYPDSPNQPAFPSTVLRPGEVYRSRTVFAFRTQ